MPPLQTIPLVIVDQLSSRGAADPTGPARALASSAAGSGASSRGRWCHFYGRRLSDFGVLYRTRTVDTNRTGLARIVGQVQAAYRDSQSKGWAKSRSSDQPYTPERFMRVTPPPSATMRSETSEPGAENTKRIVGTSAAAGAGASGRLCRVGCRGAPRPSVVAHVPERRPSRGLGGVDGGQPGNQGTK